MALDVTDEASIDQAAQEIRAEHGHLDVLVNNAGITGGPESGRPSQTPPAILRQVYETNVFGVVAVTNAMLPLLRQAPAARIVNVSSEVGSIQATLDRDGPLWPMTSIPYPSSKTALNMVTAQYAYVHQGQRRKPRLLRHQPQQPQRVSGAPRRAPRRSSTWPRSPRTGRRAASMATCGSQTSGPMTRSTDGFRGEC
jgi:NAD(P)-dependent dehydrogenase (short-subunit alcohol dehydrogenase family)